MAKHTVDIKQRGLKMKGASARAKNSEPSVASSARNADADGPEGVSGLEFKPKLSGAVLRAVGLHGGIADDGVIDLRDTEGAMYVPPPADNDACTSAADAILLMSHKYGGYFERTPGVDEDGEAFVSGRFTYGRTADVVTGSGATTKEAVRAMFAKLNETFACLEPPTTQRASRSRSSEGDDNE